MKYIVIDTCFWLWLLKADLRGPLNEFDEIMYWFDAKALKPIACKNLIREWDRNKVNIHSIIIEHRREYQSLRFDPGREQYTDDEWIENALRARVQKVDYILNHLAEQAEETNELLLEAAKRTLNPIAPNHVKDSYRDTVNLLCIIEHLRKTGYENCLFVTNNYKDFSDPLDADAIHPHLATEFSEVGLEYVFSSSKSNKLFGAYLRKIMPDYQAHIRAQKAKEDERLRPAEQRVEEKPIGISDEEYLDNITYLDMILAKPKLSAVDRHLIDVLLESHPSYKRYFFRKVGDNDLV